MPRKSLKSNLIVPVLLTLSAVVSLISFKTSWVLGVAGLCVTVACAVWYAADRIARDRHVVKTVRIYNSRLFQNHSGLNAAVDLPFPVMLLDNDGRPIFFNDAFVARVAEDLTSDELKTLISALDPGKDPSGSVVAVRSRRYSCLISEIDRGARAVYFIDEDELLRIKDEYESSRAVVMSVSLDTLDRDTSALSHDDYSEILSALERLISGWFGEYGCLIRKYNDSRFVCVAEYKNYLRMAQTKFEILDKVKTFSLGDRRIDASLSVGAAMGKDIAESEKDARLALRMARGRGGDQVAVRFGDDYEFIGGVSAQSESVGASKARLVLSALGELILASPNVVVMGHTASDFDCIGAAVGLHALCAAMNVPCRIVFDRHTSLSMPLYESFIGRQDQLFVDFNTALTQISDNTLLIITDNQRVSTLDCREIYERSRRAVIIDHHRMTVDHIENTELFYHEPSCSSTCEMVTELIKLSSVPVSLDTFQSNALLAGIILDTKNFTLRSGPKTFEAAAFLKACGADTVAVKKMFSYSPDQLSKIYSIISSASFFGSYAVAVTDLVDKNIRLLCSTAADDMLGISGVDASFVIYETDGGCSVSARSWGKVNVQLIMEHLGGGGHQNMAAAFLKDCNIAEGKQKLNTAIDKYEMAQITKHVNN